MSKRPKMTLDDILNGDGGQDDQPVHTTTFEAFGKDWTLICDLNHFALANVFAGDAGGVVKFILGLIDPAQRVEFSDTLSAVPNLTAEKLGAILNRMVEAASERPTTPPSASRPSATSRTSGRKSAASSGRPPVARLTS